PRPPRHGQAHLRHPVRRQAMTARPRPTCAISIDLDGIACYYRIHGLGPPPAELEHVILERALPRAARLFATRRIHVTLLVVARDADGDLAADRASRAGNAARLGELAA